ncbi:hypothetical protein ACVWY1_000571 [Pseudomonas sp. TE6288]|uniref:hypothetical protein n=1 Tax=Pseudomonas hunanensis TaxID=1247546 RepID=UPI0024071AB8|nr:hypothetical protein [Pseudomonas hunanensis]MDF9754259.1 hypothetical protein [Pseudomonas hunanensis]
MSFKDEGQCPFCKKDMTPTVLEKNTVRRDKCACPHCEKHMYVCRAPGCRNYARGGDLYDDEFCLSCSDDIAKFGKNAVEKFSSAAVVGGAALVTAWLASLNKKA